LKQCKWTLFQTIVYCRDKDETTPSQQDNCDLSQSGEAAADETTEEEQSEKHKSSKNRGNLKVRIDPKETKTDSTEKLSQIAAKRSTSLTSPLKTPENFVPVGDWALEVEMSSPNYDTSKTSPPLESAMKNDSPDVSSHNNNEVKPDIDPASNDQDHPQSSESEVAQVIAKSNDDQSSSHQDPEFQAENPSSSLEMVTDNKLETKEESAPETPAESQVISGFSDNFSDLTPNDIRLPISDEKSSEQQGLITGQDKDVVDVALPEDEDSDKELYEDVQEDRPALSKSDDDDDNDSFATAGSEEE